MGLLLWLAAGVASFLLARLVGRGRPKKIHAELLIAVAASLAAGLIATALDFGGWKEIDWRAALFAALLASTGIALRRLSTSGGIPKPK